MKNFKEFRNAQKNLRKRRAGGGETKMMDHSPQIQQVQGEKDAVLVEALRIYYRTKSKRDGDR